MLALTQVQVPHSRCLYCNMPKCSSTPEPASGALLGPAFNQPPEAALFAKLLFEAFQKAPAPCPWTLPTNRHSFWMAKDRGKHLAEKQGYALCRSPRWGMRALTMKVVKETVCPKTAFCFSHFKCSVKRQPLTTTKTLGINLASYIQGQEESPVTRSRPRVEYTPKAFDYLTQVQDFWEFKTIIESTTYWVSYM